MKIKEVPKHAEKSDFIFALCSFLDELNRSTDKEKLLECEPCNMNIQEIKLCILAAVTHKLSNDAGIDVPGWGYNEKYILPTPNYAFNTQKF